MQNIQVNIHHIYREANQSVDSLENHIFDQKGSLHFHSFQELPTHYKKINKCDKAQVYTFVNQK